MIRAIIIDDEKHCIDRLLRLLKEDHSAVITVEGTFQTVESGLEAIRKLNPELVFLDIQIHDKTGFDLLEEIKDKDFELVFTTAFEKYAIKAIKFSAIDYLLKPIDKDELASTIGRLEKTISAKETAGKIEMLLRNFKDPLKKICLPTLKGYEVVQVSNIIHCKSESNYTLIYLDKEKQPKTVSRTLKEFEDLLTEYNFIRVHQSHLINLAYIKNYDKGKGGMLTMTDGSEIEVSVRKKEELMKALMMM